MTDKINKDEGFDLDDILDGVRLNQTEVKVYLDETLAAKAFSLSEEVLRKRAQAEAGVKETGTIADTNPVKALEDTLAELESKAMRLTLRSLAQAEINAIRARVVRENPIKKNATADERAELELARRQTAYTHFIAQTIIKVVAPNGAEKASLSIQEVSKLRDRLPAAEWAKLCDSFDTNNNLMAAIEQEISDATFRWPVSDEA